MTQGRGLGQRAVQITVARSGTGGEAADGRGSGFQLTDDLVLTAAHVVMRHGLNPKITVRFHRPDGPGVQVAGTVVFAEEGTVGDLVLDVAVLRLDSPVPMSGPAVKFGALTDVTDCYSIGYPRFKMRNEDVYEPGRSVPVYRDLASAYGRCDPHSNVRSGTLALNLAADSDQPAPGADPGAWQGMSGAAVFVQDRLIGLVTAHYPQEAGLMAAPVRQWYDRLAATRPDRFAELASLIGLPATVEQLLLTGLQAPVRGYLKAAAKMAAQHPYPDPDPGSSGHAGPPALSEVYVRQHSRATDNRTAAGRDEPAETLFARTDPLCVLIAGPGGGKSSLLRTAVGRAARTWLTGQDTGAGGFAAVPVWVSARHLASPDVTVSMALATATGELARYGLNHQLPAERFLDPPHPGACWQLLVDDLDELPDAEQRRAVLDKLANAVLDGVDGALLYRCILATRPLAGYELDTLDAALGHRAARFDLQPFTDTDLDAYNGKYFATVWPGPKATARAQRFARELRQTRLVELARTPLMAFMLCRLHLANPERGLPQGRSAVYQAFTGLMYEYNTNKHIATSHQQAVERLLGHLQTSKSRAWVGEVARRVVDELPDLIGYLAHRWLFDRHAPAARVLVEHPDARGPDSVQTQLWDDFLEDLLQHTGLLVHYADGPGFPHQTFLEYHAARHATRNQQTRAELLNTLLPPTGQEPRTPAVEPSYLGFLLDNLLTHDDTAEEITDRIETFTRHGSGDAYRFFARQLNLKTNLPTADTARQLARFSDDTTLKSLERMSAAEGLAGIEGYGQAGVVRLEAFADDTTLYFFDRAVAAASLARVEGYRQAGVVRLEAFADDTTRPGFERLAAAENLTRVEGYRQAGVVRLEAFADDTTLDSRSRVFAADYLARVEGYRQAGVVRLEAFADDTTLFFFDRVLAAECLARLEGYRQAGVVRLEAFADDTTLDGSYRVVTAGILAGVERYRQAGVARLEAFADDTTLKDYERMLATGELEKLRAG